MPYNPKSIEPKWQRYWEENATFKVDVDHHKPKLYVLDMFPYPSGAGLHVGHPEGYTATDIVCRYKRMRGFNVLHPMGWDAYGLPAERYAMRTGVHPSITTRQNIETFRSQTRRLGFSYDWARELATTDPDYIRWTQWIFLKLYQRGLAYQAEVAVHWCPAQGTVLANEEVKEGKYVETGDPVERRLMRQWMLRITAYADRLLEDLHELDWPEGIKAMQRNWIGRSEGAEVAFQVEGSGADLSIFTTRPDTLFGATYCVLAPEHPLVDRITTEPQRELVAAYRAQAAQLSDHQRAELSKGKTGLFTGAYAINPVNRMRIPIWVADYVVMSYGTGAIMAVPAHDARDHEFATRFRLPIVPVVAPARATDAAHEAYEGDGVLINSDFLNGLSVADAKERILRWLEAAGLGTRKVQYRLRDWLFSRQRYWGEPIPILHLEDGSVVPVPEDALPVLPPELDDYRPTESGEPPLARATDWVRTTDPATGAPALRETNTMPQWAGSCWYYLRFIDPKNDRTLVDAAKERYWMPVDLYIGGAEHAVLHLLYARFWHKVLYDIGVVSTQEPFRKLFNQGMILGYSYRDIDGRYHEPERVAEAHGKLLVGATEVTRQIEKMSKSRFNVVNPDEIVSEYGADSVRLYEMFMGPLEVAKPWQTSGVAGVRRFLNRSWRLLCDEDDELDSRRVVDAEPELRLSVLLHKTVASVTEDIERLRFNTAIAHLMELVNVLTPMEVRPRKVLETFVLLLSPFAPHIAEEMWMKLGHETTLAFAPWPMADPELVKAAIDLQEYPVQINGKLRARVMAAPQLDRDGLIAAVKADPQVQRLLANVTIVKEVAVPGRLVSFVVRN
jgi:leucyl-tRNA synthetase